MKKWWWLVFLPMAASAQIDGDLVGAAADAATDLVGLGTGGVIVAIMGILLIAGLIALWMVLRFKKRNGVHQWDGNEDRRDSPAPGQCPRWVGHDELHTKMVDTLDDIRQTLLIQGTKLGELDGAMKVLIQFKTGVPA